MDSGISPTTPPATSTTATPGDATTAGPATGPTVFSPHRIFSVNLPARWTAAGQDSGFIITFEGPAGAPGGQSKIQLGMTLPGLALTYDDAAPQALHLLCSTGGHRKCARAEDTKLAGAPAYHLTAVAPADHAAVDQYGLVTGKDHVYLIVTTPQGDPGAQAMIDSVLATWQLS